MSREKTIWQAIDWWAMGIYALMLTVGWFNIYSSEFSDTQKTLIDFKLSHGKQLMWIGISMLLGFVILMMDVRIYHTLSYVIYAAMLALVIITIFVGKEVNGARGWLQIGGFQLQSAEFMKVATAMALARFLSNYGVDMKLRKDWLTALSFGKSLC
ncbi:MAG: FtsW/RodA/SpoVE family cell cycle protein [Bacteroidetes bacterium]|nr:FtsW/RodA/SpoVE family cell cycle protein [Bacteroidota bacterium]